MSSALPKVLRSDSYVELSEYRDQHFWVREAGPREGKALGQNVESWFSRVSLCRLPFSFFPETQSEAPVPAGEWMLEERLDMTGSLFPQRGNLRRALPSPCSRSVPCPMQRGWSGSSSGSRFHGLCLGEETVREQGVSF